MQDNNTTAHTADRHGEYHSTPSRKEGGEEALLYKDIFIDFDDTLYDTHGNACIALQEVYEIFDLQRFFPCPEIFYEHYWAANLKLWSQFSNGEITRDELILERFRRPLTDAPSTLGRNVDEISFSLAVSDKFLTLCSHKPGVIDGAHELMEHLRSRGYHLHICSNGFKEVQYHKLRASQLLGYFDTIILSDDIGVPKPSKTFFDRALEISGAVRETTIMIGDNYYNDILGAINSGIDAMLFNRWDKDFVPPHPVNYVVNSLREITGIL